MIALGDNPYLFTIFCTSCFICSVKRTQVLDDESDYFATDSNQWLSPSERDKLRKKEEELRELRHASHRDRKITLDFAGRQIIEEGDNLSSYYNKWVKWCDIAWIRFMSCCHAKDFFVCNLQILQIGWDPKSYERWLSAEITTEFWRADWAAKPQRTCQPQHYAECTGGRSSKFTVSKEQSFAAFYM